MLKSKMGEKEEETKGLICNNPLSSQIIEDQIPTGVLEKILHPNQHAMRRG